MKDIKFWYTADPHFGTDSNNIIKREMRPYKDILEYTNEQVCIWNKQASTDDFIYVIGDFCNYNNEEQGWLEGLAVSRHINANIILLTGNSEEKVIKEEFNGDFEDFRKFCLDDANFNFVDVKRNDYVNIKGHKFFLTHKPAEHDKSYPTLYGHTHRVGGLWRPYGLNVGTDLNHFRLYSEDDIADLMAQKIRWWDCDPNNNCFE